MITEFRTSISAKRVAIYDVTDRSQRYRDFGGEWLCCVYCSMNLNFVGPD